MTEAAQQLPDQASRPTNSPWKSMATARRDGRPILLRTRWGGERVAMVGVYVHVHGNWCTQSIFGDGQHVIHAAEGWTELPELEGGF